MGLEMEGMTTKRNGEIFRGDGNFLDLDFGGGYMCLSRLIEITPKK